LRSAQPRTDRFSGHAAAAQKRGVGERREDGARRLQRRRQDLNRVMHKVINGGVPENFFATPQQPGRGATSPRAS